MGPAFVVGANKPYLAAGELGVRMVIVLDLATPFDAIHPIIDMIAEHKVSRIAARWIVTLVPDYAAWRDEP